MGLLVPTLEDTVTVTTSMQTLIELALSVMTTALGSCANFMYVCCTSNTEVVAADFAWYLS